MQRQAEPRRIERQERRAEPRRETQRNVQRNEERSRQRAEQARERSERSAQQQRERNQRAAQEREQRSKQQAEQRSQEQRARQQAEERRREQGKASSRTTQGPMPNNGKGNEASRQDVKRVQATDEQRVRVRDRLYREHRADRDRDRNLFRGVRPIVGVHIDRRHRLHRLPIWIVEYAPIYRDYSYVWIEDSICIVDPATYTIIDILPESSQRAEASELSLTPEQMRFVYTEVPKDTSVDLRIRLALGAEVPRNVALYTFPDHVLARIPKLASFRYVVVGDDIAIVEPADYAVVLVIPG
jgi:DNA mismatch repair ATPase MutL